MIEIVNRGKGSNNEESKKFECELEKVRLEDSGGYSMVWFSLRFSNQRLMGFDLI